MTALAEHEDTLLLVQLATGRFAGFWLLPSATVEDRSVTETARRMLPERTGYPVARQALLGVVEEPHAGALALRFVFRMAVGERGLQEDAEIHQARWFTREEVRGLLAEREAVPTLGVMALIRAWADGTPIEPLESLSDDALCPCGSGYRYPGCCGWDAK